MAGEADSFILLFLAFIFPPAAVGFISGCGPDLCLNILLTLIGWLPGCIHAFWLVFRRAEANDRYGYKNWTYTGMGEYRPPNAVATVPAPNGGQPRSVPEQGQQQPPPPPPPPSGEQAKAPATPPTQAPPVGTPPPPPADQKYQPQPETVPSDQKAVQVASSEQTSEHKQGEPAPQYTATPSGA